MRTSHLLIALALGGAVLSACKKEETVAPGPADTSAATTTAASAVPPPTEPPPATGPTPTPVPQPATGPKADAGTTATDAGVKDAGATTDAGAKADAGATSQGCITKCQGILAACLTPQAGKDGGLPKIGDPVACKAAADACQAACK